MKIIAIEEKIFRAFISTLEKFIEKFEAKINVDDKKNLNKWYDTQDICLMLNISKRNVQSLRTSGKLPFTRIGKKIYYKPKDVTNLIEKGK